MILSMAILILFFLVLAFEEILYVRMIPWYFKSGVRIFQRTAPLDSSLRLPMLPDDLRSVLLSVKNESLTVREVDSNKFAIREKSLGGKGYTPVMRCLVTIDPLNKRATTTGLLNLSPFVFLLFFMLAGFDELSTGETLMTIASLSLFLFSLGMFYWVYSTQVKRFDSICEDLTHTQQGGT